MKIAITTKFAVMFTGIIEATALVKEVISNGSNKTYWLESPLATQLKVDQSVNHSGVCMTVEETRENSHRVTAVAETLKKTNLEMWEPGTVVNLERCLSLNSRLDGHIVQGHTDTTAKCKSSKEKDGSWEFEFAFDKKFAPLLIEKGSVSINGISLTLFNVKNKSFSIAIIPYTYAHTNIRQLMPGQLVNLEFDIIGKYLLRSLSLKAK